MNFERKNLFTISVCRLPSVASNTRVTVCRFLTLAVNENFIVACALKKLGAKSVAEDKILLACAHRAHSPFPTAVKRKSYLLLIYW